MGGDPPCLPPSLAHYPFFQIGPMHAKGIYCVVPSVYIKTYGCQMNERDSEAVAAQLAARGYSLARTEAAADVILLNTCSVRDMAEQKAIGKMQNVAAQVRRHRPEVVLGLLGCMAKAAARD